MRWEDLSRTHRQSAIRFLALWFVLTPIAAKFSNNPIVRTWLGGAGLPFSWYVFYAASAAFFLSGLLFAVRCPAIIKDYESWADFAEREGSFERLRPLVLASARLAGKSNWDRFLTGVTGANIWELRNSEGKRLMPGDANWTAETGAVERVLKGARIEKDRLNDLYSATRELTQIARPVSRWVCLLLQTVGWALLAAVLAQNAWSVWLSWIG